MKFKLKKINIPQNPRHPTSEDWDVETNGWTNETLSPWIGYEVEGYGENLPKVGEPFRMIREKRNGKKALGVFHTSQVEDVKFNFATDEAPYWTIETMNSVYRLEVE